MRLALVFFLLLLAITSAKSDTTGIAPASFLPFPKTTKLFFDLVGTNSSKTSFKFWTARSKDSNFAKVYTIPIEDVLSAEAEKNIRKTIDSMVINALKSNNLILITDVYDKIQYISMNVSNTSIQLASDSLRQKLIKSVYVIAHSNNYAQVNNLDWNLPVNDKYRYSFFLIMEGEKLDWQDKINQAEKLYRLALKEASLYPTLLTEQKNLAFAHNALGFVLFRKGEFQEALNHCRASFAIRTKLAEADQTLWTARNLAIIHANLHAFDSALYYYKFVDKYFNDSYHTYNNKPFLDNNDLHAIESETNFSFLFYRQVTLAMANSYLQRGQYDMALAVADSVISSVRKLGLHQDKTIAASIFKLNIYIAKAQWQQARSTILHLDSLISDDIFAFRNEYILASYKEYLKARMKVFSHFGNTDAMLSTFEKYSHFSDSLADSFDAQWQRLLNAENDIAKADIHILSEKERNIQLQYILYGAIILSVLLIIIFVLALFTLRSMKKNKILLEQKEEHRKHLTRIIVHDLKNPLTPILRASEFLLNSMSTDAHKHSVSLIHTAALNMKETVEELLHASEKTARKYERELLDIYEMTTANVELYRYYAQAKQQTLLFHCDPDNVYLAEGDASRLSTALHNIFDNAIKYTPVGGTIDISLSVAGNTLTVSVENSGTGFTTNNKPTQQGERSYGIGLQSVRDTIEQHGGSFYAGSKEHGDGVVVTLSLPRTTLAFQNNSLR